MVFLQILASVPKLSVRPTTTHPEDKLGMIRVVQHTGRLGFSVTATDSPMDRSPTAQQSGIGASASTALWFGPPTPKK